MSTTFVKSDRWRCVTSFVVSGILCYDRIICLQYNTSHINNSNNSKNNWYNGAKPEQHQFCRKDILKAHLYEHKKSANDDSKNKRKPKIQKKQNPKPFKRKELKEQCKICLKYMPSVVKLENHMRVHEIKSNLKSNPQSGFKCDVCTKSFKTAEMLKRHKSRMHHKSGSSGDTQTKPKKEINEKKFFCKMCPKGFTRSCNLKSHYREVSTHHTIHAKLQK